MHTVLIAENQHQAAFIRHGLEYENLKSEIIFFRDAHETEKTFSQTQIDGMFILVNNIFSLDKIIENCRHYYNDIPIILLAQEFNILLREFQQLKKIRRFFIRPFPFRLIAAEMRLYVYQKKEKIENSIISLRNLQLNRETHELSHEEKQINLRNKEYALLEFLMLNQNRVLSRNYILENVWDRNANLMTNTVDVHINRLRKKIDYPLNEEFIHTVSCAGYIFS